MNTVKHFNFRYNVERGLRGRFAVAHDGSKLIVSQIAGEAPTLEVVGAAIGQWPALAIRLNEQAMARQNPYAVERRVGMSGSRNYLLREVRSTITADYPIRARLHVSMYGKLNEGINMWGGDFVALYGEAEQYERGVNPFEVTEVPVYEPTRVFQPKSVLLNAQDGYLFVERVEVVEPGEDYGLTPEVLQRLAEGLDDDGEPFRQWNSYTFHYFANFQTTTLWIMDGDEPVGYYESDRDAPQADIQEAMKSMHPDNTEVSISFDTTDDVPFDELRGTVKVLC